MTRSQLLRRFRLVTAGLVFSVLAAAAGLLTLAAFPSWALAFPVISVLASVPATVRYRQVLRSVLGLDDLTWWA